MKISVLLRSLAVLGVGLVVTNTWAIDSAIDRSISWSDGVVNAVAQPLIVTNSSPPAGGDRIADPADTSTSGGVDLSGVARLFLDVDAAVGSGGLCSGSLIGGGDFLLTAAHCVTDEQGDLAVIDGIDGNTATFETAVGTFQVEFSSDDVEVHPEYNGDVRDGFDVAVIALGEVMPEDVARYELNSSIVNEAALHLAAGFGRSGDGNTGATLGAGLQRSGFNNFLTVGLPIGNITNQATQLTADFDSGLTENDAFGLFDEALFGQSLNDAINNGLGLGEDEVGIAPGDSGGPTFIQGPAGVVIAGVHSYGLRLELLGGATSDLDAELNSSFGEFYVDARVSNAELLSFIQAATIPEPSTLAVMCLGALLSSASPRRKS
ncbi:MAG: trypsin-like serine protease [Planctomycetota bacterium]